MAALSPCSLSTSVVATLCLILLWSEPSPSTEGRLVCESDVSRLPDEVLTGMRQDLFRGSVCTGRGGQDPQIALRDLHPKAD